ncbi:ABC transporter ATP-binding protein [Natrinema caseinilyticum]|uniref:ABC transporter ATP-binding protein n=1 Tax=Natrinema caseinilyticum TaxID=2961570 RepID=UPI0020C2870E|nr:ABC transporter ATP-binding protein [Natrinema caseinilyticum]
MTAPLLELDRINTAYGDSHVLHDVSLSVDDDEVVALLGRNGAGKTTTLRSIIGIQRPFSGAVQFRGEDITDEETYDTAGRGIKYVPEERRVFDTLTVEEHIRMAVQSDFRSFAEERERVFGVFPELEEFSDTQARNLSGGQQQMLAIARALIGPTELLMLDEPFEGLAPKIIQTIQETIMELKENNTILMVEQNFPMARVVADRYYILDHGSVVSSGPIEKLDENDQLKEKYLGVT